MRQSHIKTPIHTWGNSWSPEVTSWEIMQATTTAANHLVPHLEGAETFGNIRNIHVNQFKMAT